MIDPDHPHAHPQGIEDVKYLGDGIYVGVKTSYDTFQILLYTTNGTQFRNLIFLEPGQVEYLAAYRASYL